jgi:hypothetical protein
VQTFFGGHCCGQHVEADRTSQFALKASGRDRDLGLVGDRLLRSSVKFVEGQVPRLFNHFVGSHFSVF